MTVRERIRLYEAEGLSPLRARLAVLDILARRAPAELNHAIGAYRGLYREKALAESQEFWTQAWRIFRQDLETGDERAALEVLEAIIARVEPSGGRR